MLNCGISATILRSFCHYSLYGCFGYWNFLSTKVNYFLSNNLKKNYPIELIIYYNHKIVSQNCKNYYTFTHFLYFQSHTKNGKQLFEVVGILNKLL